MIRQQKTPDTTLQLLVISFFDIKEPLFINKYIFRELTGSEWISQDELELKLVEGIKPVEHRYFVSLMTRLAEHPYSFRVKEFINNYRKPLMNQRIILDIPKPQIGEDGRKYITVYGKKRNLFLNLDNF